VLIGSILSIFAPFKKGLFNFAQRELYYFALTPVIWLFQGRLTRFEVHGVIGDNLAKTAYFGPLCEVKA
jgi:hypothetical protein